MMVVRFDGGAHQPQNEETTMLNTTDKIIKHKTGLLNLAEELGNVSKACQVMGYSRDTFYRYKSAVEDGGVEALFERTRRKPNLSNRVDDATEQAVIKSATDFPAYGQARTSKELRKLGVFVSPSGVRSIWLRYDLANFKARLKALEAKVAEDGGILTEAQVQALEKKKLDDEACYEVETTHPGYLGSQDTFYVGTLKGVGRVYQQTYVDTYCKVAHAKHDQPRDFLRRTSKWHRHLDCQEPGDKRLWEVAACFHLRDAFRSGDVWLKQSRRYVDLKQVSVPATVATGNARLAVQLDPETWLAEQHA
jgi:hypothetical protein